MAAKKTKEQSLLDSMAGVSTATVAGDGALASISSIATQQYEAALEVARLEDALKVAKAQLFKLSTVDLPEAMTEAGVAEFTTADGLEIAVKREVQCAIPAARRQEAYEWLAEHNFHGLIKSSLEVAFDRDHLEDAEELAEELREKGYEFNMGQSIHPQTLKAFVKERMADTEVEFEFPLDLFGAFPYTVASVKPSKKRKL